MAIQGVQREALKDIFKPPTEFGDPSTSNTKKGLVAAN
jgi:hypothetical protein